MNGNTLGKEKETKYSPSKQRNKGKIQLAPKVYTLLCGQLENMFPNSEKGLTYNLCDSIHTYYVTTDGYVGFVRNKRTKNKKRK